MKFFLLVFFIILCLCNLGFYIYYAYNNNPIFIVSLVGFIACIIGINSILNLFKHEEF